VEQRAASGAAPQATLEAVTAAARVLPAAWAEAAQAAEAAEAAEAEASLAAPGQVSESESVRDPAPAW
jgi:hypothetical protein